MRLSSLLCCVLPSSSKSLNKRVDFREASTGSGKGVTVRHFHHFTCLNSSVGADGFGPAFHHPTDVFIPPDTPIALTILRAHGQETETDPTKILPATALKTD
jgi:hypothetical protein